MREIEPIFVAVSIDEKSTKNAKINLSHHTPSSTFCSVFLTGKPIQKGRHFEKPALNKANQSNQFEHFQDWFSGCMGHLLDMATNKKSVAFNSFPARALIND